MLQTDPIDLDRTACSAVQMAIGVEAATLMVEILIKQLQSLGSDNHFATTIGFDSLSSEETTKLFHSFANDGMEILRYCRNLLVRNIFFVFILLYLFNCNRLTSLQRKNSVMLEGLKF